MDENSNVKNVKQQVNNSNTNKGLIITLISIIIVLIGLLIYFVFIKNDNHEELKKPEEKINEVDKPKEDDNKENNTNEVEKPTEKEEPAKENNDKPSETDNKPQDNKVQDKNTYKTSDGKHTLTIKNKKFYYDNVIQIPYGDDDYVIEEHKEGKYTILSSNTGQCGTYFYIVNNQNNTLVDFNYSADKRFAVEKIGNNYYFLEGGSCLALSHGSGVYTENLKKIGSSYFGKDSNNNFYVLDNGHVVKYDKDGKTIKRSENAHYIDYYIIFYNEALDLQPIITNDNIYFMYHNDDDPKASYILVDGMNDKDYEMDTKDYYLYRFYLNKSTNIIEISFYPNECQFDNANCENDSSKMLVYEFDLKTKVLSKKNGN